MSKAEIHNSQMIDELLQGINPNEEEKIEKRMLLAARIEDVLKEKGLKKKDFAEALGKTPSEITKWLSGTHNFTCDTLFDIERVLNIVLVKLDSKQQVIIKTYHYNVTVKVEQEPDYNYSQFIYGKSFKKTYSAKKQFDTTQVN
jgi:transcriptional regulator with XRE-family HTH domain